MKTMTISKAARQAGVGVETIRFYERKGLISQPAKPLDGGFRDYPPLTVERIRFIRQAQELGFSLREAGELLLLRADPSTDAQNVRARATAKLAEVEDKISRLGHMREALNTLIQACPGRGALRQCTILDALANGDDLGGAKERDGQSL